MQKRDSFSLRSDARRLVDNLHTRGSAACEHGVKVVDGKADVMDSRPAPGQEARNRRVGIVGLKQLNEGLTGAEAHYVRPIGVVERNFGQPQNVPEKRKAPGEGLDCDSNVGYARATRG